MRIEVKSYSQTSSLLNAILFFIAGAILYIKGEEFLKIVTIGIGIVLVIFALIELGIFIKNNKTDKNLLIIAILALIASIFFFWFDLIQKVFNVVVGGWILLTGITRLIEAIKNNWRRKTVLLVTAILLVILGIVSIIEGLEIFTDIVGIFMMTYAILEIIGFIFYTKDKNFDNEKVLIDNDETLLIPENDEPEKNEKKKDKKKKIKDVETK